LAPNVRGTEWNEIDWSEETAQRERPEGRIKAKAYYHQQKAKGHRHQSILRSLAYKWQRILFRCWQNNEIYDEKHYLAALKKRSSPLLKTIAEIQHHYPKLSEQFI